ncbi:hypothetical protein ACI6Q2_19100 [Chitinophagaceae bacterium LWZ2-11]
MSTPEKTVPKPLSIQDYTIPLDVAMNRTNYWRETVKPIYGDDMDKVPKAFFIPIDDIMCLAENFQKYNIAGVRAYFTFHSMEDTAGITAVLVPVVPTKQVSANGDVVIVSYSDMLSLPVNDEKLGDAGDSTIYDFSQPCPPFCDPESDLY